MTETAVAALVIGCFGMPDAAAQTVPARATASSKEKLALAGRQVGVIESASASVQTELRMARETRDRARVECLDELLTRVHVAARSARSLRENVTMAAAQGDVEGIDRELYRLHHLRERTSRLVSEASRCGERETVIERPGATVVRILSPKLPEGAAAYPPHPHTH